LAVLAGCGSGAAVGMGGTASGTGGGFTVTTASALGFRVGDFDVGLTENVNFGSWRRTGDAYSQLNEWASSGATDCCGDWNPIVTFFKYIGLGMGYMTAWVLATDSVLLGPRLRYYVSSYAPTVYFDFGVGPAAYFNEDADTNSTIGIGMTATVGYMFNPYSGVELRGTWGNADDPQWATISVGMVIRPKKRFFGLFGKNDLERPAIKQPPPPPMYPPQPAYPPPYPQQPLYPPPSSKPPAQTQPPQPPPPPPQPRSYPENEPAPPGPGEPTPPAPQPQPAPPSP
jgi:hypothetical protein